MVMMVMTLLVTMMMMMMMMVFFSRRERGSRCEGRQLAAGVHVDTLCWPLLVQHASCMSPAPQSLQAETEQMVAELNNFTSQDDDGDDDDDDDGGY